MLGIKVFDLCTLLWFIGAARGPPGTTLGAVFICNAGDLGFFVPLKCRWLEDCGDVKPNPKAPPLIGEEAADEEEDIKLSPNPRFGLLAELRDALRPRVAKKPPLEGEVMMDECLVVMEGEMGERGVVEPDGGWRVRGASVLVGVWVWEEWVWEWVLSVGVLLLPPIEGKVEFEPPSERMEAGGVIVVMFGELAALTMLDAAAR